MKPDDTPSNETPTRRSTNESATNDRKSTQRDGPVAISDRYAAISLTEGASVVYERGNPNVWIQSDAARPIEDMI